MSARIPDARLTSHQMRCSGAFWLIARRLARRRCRRSIPLPARPSRQRRCRARSGRHDRRARAARPAVRSAGRSSRASRPRAPSLRGPWRRQARSRQADHCSGRAGGARSDLTIPPDPDIEAGGRDPAAGDTDRADRPACERMLDLHLVGRELCAHAADRDIAATVHNEPGEPPEPVGDGVSAQSLPGSPRIEHDARGPPDDSGDVVDLDLAPPRRRVGLRRHAWWGRGECVDDGCRLHPVERGVVAGALERRHEGWVKQPGAPLCGPQSGRHGRRSSADAGTSRRGSRLSAESSLSGTNRDRRCAKSSTNAFSRSAAASGSGALGAIAPRSGTGCRFPSNGTCSRVRQA